MSEYSQKIAKAKAAGYSDAEIASYLSSDSALAPKIQQAKAAGYSDADILGHLSGDVSPRTPTGGAGKIATKPLPPVQTAKPAIGDTLMSGLKQNYEDFMSVPREASKDLAATADRVIGTRVRKLAKGDFSGTAAPGQTQQQADMQDALALGGSALNYVAAPINGAIHAAVAPATRAANNALVDSGRVMPTIGLERAKGNLLPTVTVDRNVDREQSFRNLDNAIGTVGSIASMALGNESGGASALSKASKAGKAAKMAKAPIVPLEDLRAAKQAAYQAVDSAGVRYNPQAVDELASSITKDALANNISPVRHPHAYSMMKDIQALKGSSPTLTEVDQLRQVIRRDVANSKDPAEAFFGKRMINELDNFVDNAGAQHVMTGSASDASGLVKTAREANTKYRKSETVTDAVEKAKLRAASTGSGGNADNAIRQNLRSVLEKTPNLTPEEKAALETVVKGSRTQNMLRTVGKLSPGGNGLMTALSAGAAGASGGLSVPVSVAGFAAKMAADRMTVNNVNEVLRVISAEKPTVSQIQKAQVQIAKMPRGPLSNALQKAVVANAGANVSQVPNYLAPISQGAPLSMPSYAAKAAADTPKRDNGPSDESGMVEPGNIDLNARPVVNNLDGSYSTVRSISVEFDDKTYLLPTVVNGRVVSNDEAIQHFKDTGEHLGAFKDGYSADQYAEKLHEEQAKQYKRK